jgi:hypothetical protein
MAYLTTRSKSSTCNQLMYWFPEPAVPPNPSRARCSNLRSAPPLGLNTNPRRSTTGRVRGHRWRSNVDSQRSQTSGEKPVPRGAVSSQTRSPGLPYIANEDACTHTRGGAAHAATALPRASTDRRRDSMISRRFALVYRQSTLLPVRLTTASASSRARAQSPTETAFHTTWLPSRRALGDRVRTSTRNPAASQAATKCWPKNPFPPAITTRCSANLAPPVRGCLGLLGWSRDCSDYYSTGTCSSW